MSNNENNLKFFFNSAIKNHQENNFKDAEKFYNKVLEIESSHFDSVFYLGSLYAQVKNFIKSKELFEKAIKIQPKYAISYSNLAAVLKELGNFEEAATVCKRAIEIEPNNVAALGNLALVLIELGEILEAINCYKRLNNITSNSSKYYKNIGQLNIVLGNTKEAKKYYELAVKYDPNDLSNYYHLSNLDSKILNTNLKKYVNKTVLENKSNKNLVYANFILSKYSSIEKNHEEEFNYLIQGHSSFLESEKQDYRNDVEYWLSILPNSRVLNQAIIETKKENKKDLRPIFIVGVPRCGSTLVEKIIASGSQKIPMGEEMGILSLFVKKKIIKQKPFFIDNKILNEEIIKKYKQRKLIQEDKNFVFTDKTLDNFFYIDIIKEVFPKAKVINCKRSHLSSIMSILKNSLPAIPWTHNMKDIFKYFDIYHNKIMHYQNKYPGFIYPLEYEKLVMSPEEESKKLMAFCNLPWDKKCLEFHKRKDLISKTASNMQVRKAIYKDSQKKYLPYKNFLKRYGIEYSWYI